MANIKSAIKRARQNEKLRKHNASLRSKCRTYIKNVIKTVNGKEPTLAREAYQKAQKVIDQTVTKGIFHKNKAARIKSRLVARLKTMDKAS